MPGDVLPHPRTTMELGDEWLTNRELCVTLIGMTKLRPEEHLAEADITALRRR